MKACTKSLNLHLYNGNLKGALHIEDPSWESGELFAAPRNMAKTLLKTDACKNPGLYLLISQDRAYVGKSTQLSGQLAEHLLNEDWWERIVVLVAKNNSLTDIEISYLESLVAEKAHIAGHKESNSLCVDADQQAVVKKFFGEAQTLMEFTGVTVFSQRPSKENKNVSLDPSKDLVSLFREAHPYVRVTLGKAAAMQLVRSHGIDLNKNTTLATLQGNAGRFWANPQQELLTNNWHLILNDNDKLELIVLSIPANSLKIREGERMGLICRRDKPTLIDLQIDCDTLIDKASGIHFTPYEIMRIPY